MIFDDIFEYFGFLKKHGEILEQLGTTFGWLDQLLTGWTNFLQPSNNSFYFGKFVLVTSKLLRRGPADFKMSQMLSKIFKIVIADFDDF